MGKLTDFQITRILSLAAKGNITAKQLAARFNTTPDAIVSLCRRRGVELKPEKTFDYTDKRDLARGRTRERKR